MLNKRGLIAILILASCLRTARAETEYWTHHFPDSMPSAEIYALASFNGKIYLSGIKPNTSALGLWRSSSSDHWEQVNFPGADPAAFLTHKGFLFVHEKYALSGNGRVYRSNDGDQWNTVLDSNSGLSDWITYQGMLIEVKNDGSVIRTVGDQTPVVWESLPRLPDTSNTTVQQITLADYQGFLHAAVTRNSNSPGINTVDIYRLNAGPVWEQVGAFTMDFTGYATSESGPIRLQLLAHGSELYAVGAEVLHTSGEPQPYSWAKYDLPAGPKLACVIFGQVHVFGPSFSIMALTEQGWKQTSLDRIKFVRGGWQPVVNYNPAAILGNNIVIHGQEMYSLGLGVIEMNYKPFPGAPIYSGRSGTVLGFSIKANFWDKLLLRVKNLGTAVWGRDIKSIKLVRSTAEVGSSAQTEILADLTPDDQNKMTFSIPSSVRVNNGDNLYISVEATNNPLEGANFIAAVDKGDAVFSNNIRYTLPTPVVSAQAIEIKNLPQASAQAAIGDVFIFPSPAKNIVNFKYDLVSDSDVSIKIFNRHGHLVSEINEPHKLQGSGVLTIWDATFQASDVYFAHFEIIPALGTKRTFQKRVYIEK